MPRLIEPEDYHENLSRVTEHGQDWLLCGACGAIWSIVETDRGEDLEVIEHGDDSCTENVR